ncbi:uncharacterized protein EDB91DRAFT_1254660 [Suillus paluster]|uniref:uncharacterized protein n=1 Tax=Suillus paluster TaxID=48578 RepID=UPI001B8816B1|nr:uncharacterized protein EDB91DRAFT_1254660 [Suillus paluster]KAG1725722.1 hypothetical protein EDB91DRAFT_1254660 [Suillus paluster]
MPAKNRNRKSTVGGNVTGLSRAGPGTVDIGTMVPQHGTAARSFDVASVSPTIVSPSLVGTKARSTDASNKHISHLSSTTSSDDIHVGKYCHFCCDQIQAPFYHECVECGAFICQQYVPRSSGCIYFGTVEDGKEFLCPNCCRTGANKNAPLPYAIFGFSMRKKVKMTWPMAVVHLSLESTMNDYIGLTVKHDLDSHYRDNGKNLLFQSLYMRPGVHEAGVHQSEARKLVPGATFMQRNIEAGFPPNTFVLVNTHSDKYSGMLQHHGAHDGGTDTTIAEITAAYLSDFLNSMVHASHAARSDKTEITTKRGKKPWTDLTPKVRGGRRGLMLVSCGPAIRVRHHFDSIVELVQKDQFDFVLGFGGSGTLPSTVSSIIRSVVVEFGVFGRTDVWPSFCDIMSSYQSVLDNTTAVLVYAQVGVEGQRQVECRQLAKNVPGLRAFGAEYKSCGTPGCNPAPSDIRVFNQVIGTCKDLKPKVRVQCLKCNWKSTWAVTDQDNEHFKRVNPISAPQIFWHRFPPSAALQNFFVDLTLKMEQVSAKESTSQGKKQYQRAGATSEIDTLMVDAEGSGVDIMDID